MLQLLGLAVHKIRHCFCSAVASLWSWTRRVLVFAVALVKHAVVQAAARQQKVVQAAVKQQQAELEAQSLKLDKLEAQLLCQQQQQQQPAQLREQLIAQQLAQQVESHVVRQLRQDKEDLLQHLETQAYHAASAFAVLQVFAVSLAFWLLRGRLLN